MKVEEIKYMQKIDFKAPMKDKKEVLDWLEKNGFYHLDRLGPEVKDFKCNGDTIHIIATRDCQPFSLKELE